MVLIWGRGDVCSNSMLSATGHFERDLGAPKLKDSLQFIGFFSGESSLEAGKSGFEPCKYEDTGSSF